MSVRSDTAAQVANSPSAGVAAVTETISAVQLADSQLGEASGFNTANPDHPLKRSLVVSIKASLNDLCLRKNRATWAPSEEALKNIFQCALPSLRPAVAPRLTG